MFTSVCARTLFASVVLAMLWGISTATAQEEGFIEAPTPAVLEPPTDAQALEQVESDWSRPEAPSVADEMDDMIDYRKGDALTSKGGDCDCNRCGCDDCDHCGCDDCDHCGCDGCGCRCGRDLFGCLRRMLKTCADHKQARCAGCYDMNCDSGRQHDPNRTPAASGQLFRQYYAQPRCGGVSAQMYVAPYPVPPAVGHTYITYQAFEPHQFMYRHKRTYARRHGPGGGTTKTHVYWW